MTDNIDKNEEIVDHWDIFDVVEETPATEKKEEKKDNPLDDVDTDAIEDEAKADSEDKSADDKESDGGGKDETGKEEEEDTTTPGEEEESVIGLLGKTFGFEDIDISQFEDTEEGVVSLAREASKRMADDYIDQRFEEFPMIKEVFEYVSLGGDPKNYFSTQFPEVDYEDMKFDENNTELHERLVKEDLVARGYSGEELKEELEDIKNGGILESKAKRALTSLKAKQRSEKESLIEERREAVQKEQEATKKYWQDVQKKVEGSSSFRDLKVPEREKKPFLDFLMRPVKDGKSKWNLAFEQASDEDTLAVAYLFYKDFDLTSLVDRRAKDMRAKSLKEKLVEAKLRKKGSSADPSTLNAELGDL